MSCPYIEFCLLSPIILLNLTNFGLEPGNICCVEVRGINYRVFLFFTNALDRDRASDSSHIA